MRQLEELNKQSSLLVSFPQGLISVPQNVSLVYSKQWASTPKETIRRVELKKTTTKQTDNGETERESMGWGIQASCLIVSWQQE